MAFKFLPSFCYLQSSELNLGWIISHIIYEIYKDWITIEMANEIGIPFQCIYVVHTGRGEWTPLTRDAHAIVRDIMWMDDPVADYH